MMIRLTKPLPQVGKVVPAGVILKDAPEALMQKLVRQGRAEWVAKEARGQVNPPPAPLPVSVPDEKPEVEVPTKAETEIKAKPIAKRRNSRKRDEAK